MSRTVSCPAGQREVVKSVCIPIFFFSLFLQFPTWTDSQVNCFLEVGSARMTSSSRQKPNCTRVKNLEGLYNLYLYNHFSEYQNQPKTQLRYYFLKLCLIEN